jgi:transposase
MKTEFEARPVYLQRDDRIEAHFLTCFIALMIYRILEKQLDDEYTCSELIKAMKEMSKSNFYYCNVNTPANILKFQPIVKGENYNLEMLITLNKEYMAS